MDKMISSAGCSIYTGVDALNSIPDILQEIGIHPSRCFILADEHTAMQCLPHLNRVAPVLKSSTLIMIPSGESHKVLESCQTIWQKLSESKAGRDAIIINIGGGMICDLGGFAASVYKRGILFINIPTSLLAMVDASSGGKNGIDAYGIKNLIGTFREPHSVIIDPGFLETLSERHLVAGYAEMLKHGLVADAGHFKRLIEAGPLAENIQAEIEVSVRIKLKITEEDPFETGKRQLLNLGHTFGHAYESWSLKNREDSLLHGEAVLAGMVACTFLSHIKGLLSDEGLDEILNGLSIAKNLEIPSAEFDEELLEWMRNDKKANAGEIKFTLLKGIADACYGQSASEQEIFEALKSTREFCRHEHSRYEA